MMTLSNVILYLITERKVNEGTIEKFIHIFFNTV